MKSQRKTQQVKGHVKTHQNKPKRRWSLSEKEFRIMIVQMIQNLENKMETQMSTLDTWIEKMEEMFSKDLGEIKNSQ